MKRRTLITLVCSALFLTAIQSSNAETSDTIKKSFKVGNGGTLTIDSVFGGIDIKTSRGKNVEIEIEKRVCGCGEKAEKDLLDDIDIDITKSGDNVSINTKFTKSCRKNIQLSLQYTVTVPENYNIDLNTVGGNISVKDINGDVYTKTVGGSICLKAIEGDIDANTAGGCITVGDVDGNVDVTSAAGNISLSSVDGSVDATTAAGSIDVYLDSDDGLDIDAKTVLGKIRTDFPVRVSCKMMTSSVNTSINGGGSRMHLRTSVGNINLREM